MPIYEFKLGNKITQVEAESLFHARQRVGYEPRLRRACVGESVQTKFAPGKDNQRAISTADHPQRVQIQELIEEHLPEYRVNPDTAHHKAMIKVHAIYVNGGEGGMSLSTLSTWLRRHLRRNGVHHRQRTAKGSVSREIYEHIENDFRAGIPLADDKEWSGILHRLALEYDITPLQASSVLTNIRERTEPSTLS